MRLIDFLNLDKNEIREVSLEKLAANPSAPVLGQIYYNTVDNEIKVCTDPVTPVWESAGAVQDIVGNSPITVSESGGIFTIDILAATSTNAGSMSAADKLKLDNATSASTASTLVQRDASGDFSANRITTNDVTVNNTPTVATDAVNKQYVDNLVTGQGAFVGDYDVATNSPNFPSTGSGIAGAIESEDYWYITSAGTLGTSTVVNIGDVLYAKVDGATLESDFFVVESNRGQATESERGVAEIATQAETDLGVDDERIVTPLKLGTYLQNIAGTRKLTSNITGTGFMQSYTITHNLGTQDVVVSVRDTVSGHQVGTTVLPNSLNTLTIEGRGVNGRTYTVTVVG